MMEISAALVLLVVGFDLGVLAERKRIVSEMLMLRGFDGFTWLWSNALLRKIRGY